MKVVSWLSAMARFGNFYMGILDLSDIIYYLSIIFVFLFLSTQVIKKKMELGGQVMSDRKIIRILI